MGVLIDQNSQSGIGGLLFLLGLLGLFIGILVGFALWAGAKGYSPWLGVVLAWIGPFGGKGKRDTRHLRPNTRCSFFSLPVATPVGIRSVRPSPSSAKAPFSAAVVPRLIADFEVARKPSLCQLQRAPGNVARHVRWLQMGRAAAPLCAVNGRFLFRYA